MRYSKQRELVLQKVRALCSHPTAEDIYRAALPECPGLSLGTVYRNLNSLVEAGLVRRVPIPGKSDRFDHTLRPHSHLYCTQCGAVVDIELDESKVVKLAKSAGGSIDGCTVTFYGVCAACRERTAACGFMPH